jgi:predicted CopG family antitoxin
MEKKTIEVSEDLYGAIQKLKEVFEQMTGQKVESDEDVLSILIGGFIDSLSQGAGEGAAEGTDAAELEATA